jgi:uncharacterized protein
MDEDMTNPGDSSETTSPPDSPEDTDRPRVDESEGSPPPDSPAPDIPPPEPPLDEAEPLSLSIIPSQDKMALLFSAKAPPDRLEELLQLLRTKLQSMGIHDGQKLKSAEQCVRNAETPQHEWNNLVILEGTPPIPPKDGEIEWQGNFFEEGFVIVDEERDQVDYRQHAANKSVSAGQLLATLTPPQEGEPGIDVFGKMVRTRPARPARLRAGKNVEYRDTDAYYSTLDGRIRFIGGTVHVDDVFTINGSVGLETGNIKHPGAIIITKDIESDARVEAEGDLEIYGNIEDADVHAGGEIYVHGGIAGGDHCTIRSTGTIKAKFIQNADIEAEGDVIVQREIDKSSVRCRGFMIVGSRIVGGEIQALGGIEADQIGSEGCVRTSLIAGEDYLLTQKVAILEEELGKRHETLDKITDRLKPLKDRPVTLSPKLREVVRLLSEESDRLQAVIIAIEEEIAAIRAESKERAKREILAKKIIYPETSYQLMSLTLVVREEVPGPVKVVVHDGDIHLMEAHLFR